MQFTVSGQELTFHAEFYGKYSIICGDSAIGKTTLYNFLLGAEDGTVGYTIEIDYAYHVLDRRDVAKDVLEYENTLLIMDEDCKVLHLPDTATVLRESNNRFLIISRKVPAYLPLGIKNVYSIQNKGTLYNLVQEYQKIDKRKFCGINKIITEDSDAGYYYFVQNFGIKCVSSNGNGNLCKVLSKENASEDTLVVFDSSGIVPVAKKLYRYLKRHNVQFLDWDSFESYILTQPAIVQEIDYDDISGESVEQISTKRLHELLNYNKSELPSCLVYSDGCTNCNDHCIYKDEQFSADLSISKDSSGLKKLSVF